MVTYTFYFHLQIKLLFPEEGQVYDFMLDDADICSTVVSLDEDDEASHKVLYYEN